MGKECVSNVSWRFVEGVTENCVTSQKAAAKGALLPLDRSVFDNLVIYRQCLPSLPRWKQLTQTVGREIFSN